MTEAAEPAITAASQQALVESIANKYELRIARESARHATDMVNLEMLLDAERAQWEAQRNQYEQTITGLAQRISELESSKSDAAEQGITTSDAASQSKKPSRPSHTPAG